MKAFFSKLFLLNLSFFLIGAISPLILSCNFQHSKNIQINHQQNYSQKIANIYQQNALQKPNDKKQKSENDTFSTPQWLLIMIPLIVLPSIVISIIFFKKNRQNKELKKSKK